MDMRNWSVFDKLLEILGGEKLSETLISYMDSDTSNKFLEMIAKDYEIEED